MTLANLIKDLIDTSKERIKNPISGAFLWSFAIWNWRPIFLLLFSSASIENKIIVINNQYCDFWAILFPAFIALLYIILLPKLMLEIDNSLIETTKLRKDNRSKSEIYDTEQKKKLAQVEFELKEIESGSKKLQDQLDEIKIQKEQFEIQQESFSKIIDANKATIDELNKSLSTVMKEKLKLEEKNEFLNFQNVLIDNNIALEEKLLKEVMSSARILTRLEFNFLKSLEVDEENKGIIPLSRKGEMDFESLSQKGILSYIKRLNNLEFQLNEVGNIITQTIKSVNS